jgi:predicted nucleotidyltransferase
MLTSPEFKELLKLFEEHDVSYLIIGGYAVAKYSEPRFTKDIDILISIDSVNAKKVYEALKEFGAPLENLSPDDFSKEGYFYQMGRDPLRIDIMMSIPGVEFGGAWAKRETVDLDGINVNFISLADLIKAKEAGGRPQDMIDLENLKRSLKKDLHCEK